MEENEVELSLGLSIGGSFRKFDKPAKDSASLPESKSDITSLSNSGDNHYDSEQKKCEIHALRRQEAKRKREVKKKRGRIVVGSVDNNHNNNNDNDDNDNNTNESDGGSEAVMKKRLCINPEEVAGGIQMPVLSSAPAPAAFPVQFGQFSNVQFVNFGNGFAFPYHMVPFWAAAPAPATATATGEEKSENNVYYPLACRPLQGFLVERGNGGGVKSGESSGAAASSSSAVSESRKGMSSSSSREKSHSVESKSNQQQLQNSLKSNAEAQTEHSDSSHCATECAAQVIEEEQNTHKNKIILPKTTTATTNKSIDSIQRKAEEEESNSIHKPSPPPPPSNLPLMKKCNGGGDSNKPPKPQSKSPPLPRVQLPLLRSQSLPQMPCVSTTGDGPNGKKINGFLYKYSKTEVSIMCVCHGRSFTPAEFVEHAGRTDVSHPLKHIVVVPSAFR